MFLANGICGKAQPDSANLVRVKQLQGCMLENTENVESVGDLERETLSLAVQQKVRFIIYETASGSTSTRRITQLALAAYQGVKSI